MLGGCSCLLIGDWGQLPPVMDLPLYSNVSRTELSDLGSTTNHMFHCAIVLEQVMRQAGKDADQEVFRNLLLRLRNAESTLEDWKCLMRQTPAQVRDVTPFSGAIYLYPSTKAVAEHNVSKLRASGQPVAVLKAIHSGPGASKASPDDAGGLEPAICIAHGARVMLTSNLWVDVGLVNGAIGTIVTICYEEGQCPPDLPVAVTVLFDTYKGPTLSDGTVPITPLRRTWFTTTHPCSRLQLPLKLAWAITIHKAQGLTLERVVIDIGKKEFSTGLTFVACSRVRHITDLLFVPPFAFQRLSNLSKSSRLSDRQKEDSRLLQLMSSSSKGNTASDGNCGVPPFPFQCLSKLSKSSRLSDRLKEDDRLLQLTSCSSKGNTESDGDCGVFTCRAEPYTCPFKYHPVDADWQRTTCRSLGLRYCGSNDVALGGPDICLTSPLTLRPIIGNGNCLFRTFSFIITGEEEQHMVIRQAIVQHMRSISQLLWGAHVSSTSYPGGIEQYITKNNIDCVGTWGTDVEMLTLAHLLDTAILSYVLSQKR